MRQLFFVFSLIFCSHIFSQQPMLLNGNWDLKAPSGIYSLSAQVPGLIDDPAKFSSAESWLRKEIQLPNGNWNFAVLKLYGARFNPKVYVDGKLVSSQEGGMAPTFHLIKDNTFSPGKKVSLEICLTSLAKISNKNASYIPPADQWRSNISSWLWDDVELTFHKNYFIQRVIPFTDFDNSKLKLAFNILPLKSVKKNAFKVKLELTDSKNNIVLTKKTKTTRLSDTINVVLPKKILAWTPENPNLYKLKLTVLEKGHEEVYEMPYAFKKFEAKDKQFYLNNNPVTLRGGTVVWHRWMRDSFGAEHGLDTTWFIKNVILPLKERGANYLRFHLGNPPRRLLKLCDRYGLLVQYEWSFFHGLPATKESLGKQWFDWLNHSLMHPSVAIIHPYNETNEAELKTAWNVLDSLATKFPDMVLADRDVLHIHKYWWSLFENVGMYYDSYTQFDKAVMVDEFGGNYLDENYNPGGYTTLKESFLRFLGPNHTALQRKYHHTIANAHIAEYWRLIGAAGISPFCIIGSWADGNHWYEGDLSQPKLKPVWDALTSTFSPVSVIIDNWNRTYKPGENTEINIQTFNEQNQDCELKVKFGFYNEANATVFDTVLIVKSNAHESKKIILNCKMPFIEGAYTMKAELLNRPEQVKCNVISFRDFRVFNANMGELDGLCISTAFDELELKEFFTDKGLHLVPLSENKNGVYVLGNKTWNKMKQNDKKLLSELESTINRGVSVLLLDVGNKFLGKEYPSKENDFVSVVNSDLIKYQKTKDSVNFVFGSNITISKTAEAESHIHPATTDSKLYEKMKPDFCWLWNGMRGGIVCPAEEMEIDGLDTTSFKNYWVLRGASQDAIVSKDYYAYQLEGFYDFSEKKQDAEMIKKLRAKVQFLLDDAPALAGKINPDANIKITNLHTEYKLLQYADKFEITPLVYAGKNLTRIPVIQMNFGARKGKMIVSQLLTEDRLYNKSKKKWYQAAEDETAKQLVLNMIKCLVK